VEVVTAADRDGHGDLLADAYDASPLAAARAAARTGYMAETEAHAPPAHLAAELATQHSTVTPMWYALKIIVRYRTRRNYADPEFVLPRIADKFLMTVLIFTLFLRSGANTATDNVNNIACACTAALGCAHATLADALPLPPLPPRAQRCCSCGLCCLRLVLRRTSHPSCWSARCTCVSAATVSTVRASRCYGQPSSSDSADSACSISRRPAASCAQCH
jgi:hypothetical protein